MRYLIDHTVLYDGFFVDGHFNWFHAAFVVVALAIMIYCWKKIRNMKKEMEDLEQQLSSKVADFTVGSVTPAEEEVHPAEAKAET